MTLLIVVALEDVDVTEQGETLHHVFSNELTPPSQGISFVSYGIIGPQCPEIIPDYPSSQHFVQVLSIMYPTLNPMRHPP
jgi:hypothetical protein